MTVWVNEKTMRGDEKKGLGTMKEPGEGLFFSYRETRQRIQIKWNYSGQ